MLDDESVEAAKTMICGHIGDLRSQAERLLDAIERLVRAVDSITEPPDDAAARVLASGLRDAAARNYPVCANDIYRTAQSVDYYNRSIRAAR
jgi:hypothetical protein